MGDFAAVNTIYAEFFGETKPARSCVEVSRLPKDVLVEVESVSLQPQKHRKPSTDSANPQVYRCREQVDLPKATEGPEMTLHA